MDNITVKNRFEMEIVGLSNWLGELCTNKDGELIAKLEVILDHLTVNFIRFLKETGETV